ncbi:hypothetical protein LSG31_20115 [Fodinisporobacter ferrooxydans]|uniref:Prepilin-type N-terminal cleavage/methylation domain-containing protein n=1 Tax=Fodinisporobacter ferrooxydans TaxID=2901836 RepID=A0ABY4CI53_9BACL|nr:hypothetical protein LSG31_20115 [Alicyclobacillaceae bacterium MYW30-H2]
MQILKQHEGMLLIELLLALMVVSIVSSMTIAGLKRYLEIYMLNQYAMQVKADITYCQEEAIRTHSVCLLQWQRLRPAYQILANGIVYRRNPPSFITYKYNYFNFPSSEITYNYYGRTSTSGQIILTDSYGDIRNLVLYMQSGQVSILPYILQHGS